MKIALEAVLALLVVVVACAACGGKAGDAASQPDASGASADASDASDASDADACVFIDVTTYDRSCAKDGDCIMVSAGLLCSTQCLCGGSTINADGEARYQEELSRVPPGTGPRCGCPFLGRPRCIHAECVFCSAFSGPNPPGCPDGG